MLSKEQKAAGKRINSLILRNRFKEAIALAKKELKLLPPGDWDAHWLYAQLSSAYYEQKKYKIALRYARKAHAITKSLCPLVLWHLAGALCYGTRKDVKKAIKLYHDILEMKRFIVCNESRPQMTALRSDCRIRLAINYYRLDQLQKAVHWGKMFVRYFPLGKLDRDGYSIEGVTKKEFGIKWLKRVKAEIANEANR